jgi:hypothetical protein
MRSAEAGISRREGRCVWSACRCEISTMSAWAALGGGIGPRTRRRWPRRAVRTGSNKTVVPSSCQVLVLCPHHVSDAVTARPTRPTVWTLVGPRSRSQPSSCRCTFVDRSRQSLSRRHPARWAWSRISPFCDRGGFSDRSDHYHRSAVALSRRGLRRRMTLAPPGKWERTA